MKAANGECIFSIIPKSPALFESEEALFRFGLREQGEHQWRWQNDQAIDIRYYGNDVRHLREDGTMGPPDRVIGKWSIFRKQNG